MAGCKEMKPIKRGNLCDDCKKSRRALHQEAKRDNIPLGGTTIPDEESQDGDDVLPVEVENIRVTMIIDAIAEAMATIPYFTDEYNRYIYATSKGRYSEKKGGPTFEQWTKLGERPPVKAAHLMATFIQYGRDQRLLADKNPTVINLRAQVDAIVEQGNKLVDYQLNYMSSASSDRRQALIESNRGRLEFTDLYAKLSDAKKEGFPVQLSIAESRIIDAMELHITTTLRTLKEEKEKLEVHLATFMNSSNPFVVAEKLLGDYINQLTVKIAETKALPALYDMFSVLCMGRVVYDPYNKHWYLYNSDITGHLTKVDVYQIIGEIRRVYDEQIEGYVSQCFEAAKPEKAMVDKIFHMLKSQVYGCNERSQLITNLKVSCYDSDLHRYIDLDYSVIGVINGVIQLDDIPIPRRGRMSDYVSLCSPCYYDPRYTMESPGVVWILQWMKQLFDDDLIVHEFMKYCASLLGESCTKHFYIWLGPPHSGKTAVAAFLELVLGPYFTALSESTICGAGTKAGQADPNLASIHKCRLAMAPDVGDKLLNTGLLKRLTGHDTFYARELYSQGASKQARCNIAGTFNHKPRFNEIDQAMIDRIFTIPFDTKWDKHAPKDLAEQKKQRHYLADTSFNVKLVRYRNEALWLMIRYWDVYRKEGINLVSTMIQSAEEVKLANVTDIDQAIKEFIDTHCERASLGQEAKLLHIKKRFNNWLLNTYNNLIISYNKLPQAEVTKKFMTLGYKTGHTLLLKLKPLQQPAATGGAAQAVEVVGVANPLERQLARAQPVAAGSSNPLERQLARAQPVQ